MTLIEVMLVLALMVVIAAFCWPAFTKAFSNQRLRKSADIVRTQLCKSRVKAMSTNRIVLFRYEMNGSRFRIEQASDASSFEDQSNGDAAGDLSGTSPAETAGNYSAVSSSDASQHDDYDLIGGMPTLPAGIVFRVGEIENDSRAMTVNANAADATSDAMWSAPIYFYPDGTSSDARLQIAGDRGRGIELMLRGLTGVVKVGEITAMEGVTP